LSNDLRQTASDKVGSSATRGIPALPIVAGGILAEQQQSWREDAADAAPARSLPPPASFTTSPFPCVASRLCSSLPRLPCKSAALRAARCSRPSCPPFQPPPLRRGDRRRRLSAARWRGDGWGLGSDQRSQAHFHAYCFCIFYSTNMHETQDKSVLPDSFLVNLLRDIPILSVTAP